MDVFVRLASQVHRLFCRIKFRFYNQGWIKSKSSPLPVISVGNITFGGSEKTPLVMHLLSLLQQQGRKPAVVTRGYKGGWEHSGGILSDGRRKYGSWRKSGDEPAMIGLRFPSAGIFVGQDRISSCQKAVRMGFDSIILDDGFQHLRLRRNLDIVLHDPSEKIRLRESLNSLNRAHILLLKGPRKADPVEKIHRKAPDIRIFFYRVKFEGLFKLSDGTPCPIHDLNAYRLLSFSGIAKPKRFQSMLSEAGLNPVRHLSFPDHYNYPEASRDRIRREARAQEADALITTEKDAVKVLDWEGFSDTPIYVLRIRLEIEKGFEESVFRRLDGEERPK